MGNSQIKCTVCDNTLSSRCVSICCSDIPSKKKLHICCSSCINDIPLKKSFKDKDSI